MAPTIRLTLLRYRPEEESEPTFQTYEVPFRKDWVVLDALNISRTTWTDRFRSAGRAGWACAAAAG